MQRRPDERAHGYRALQNLGLSAAALVCGSQPALAEMAEELSEAARVFGSRPVPNPLRGVILARMFVAVARLCELAHSAAPGRGADPDDPVLFLAELAPTIRGCVAFVSDEIADYARTLAREGVAGHHGDDLVESDRRMAQAIHDRDAAYAAAQARHLPAVVDLAGILRYDVATDLWGEDAPGAEDAEGGPPEKAGSAPPAAK